jgi:hypothetical protein
VSAEEQRLAPQADEVKDLCPFSTTLGEMSCVLERGHEGDHHHPDYTVYWGIWWCQNALTGTL